MSRLDMRMVGGWCALATVALFVVRTVFAGWLGLLAPASSVIEGLTTIGFFGFFLFLAAMGVAILRQRVTGPEATPAPAL